MKVRVSFPNLTTYHYQNDGDIFVLFNEDGGNVFEGEVALKAKGTPVRYYPWENRLEQATGIEEKKHYTRIPLKIQPLELTIIVFEDEKRKDVPTAVCSYFAGAAAA